MLKKWMIALLAVLMLGGCGQAAEDKKEKPEMPEASETQESAENTEAAQKGPFEQFTAEDIDGNEVTEAVFADYDLTVINVWGTFCGPCVSEMPALGELAEEYAEKRVQFIGIVGDAFDIEGKIDWDIVSDAKTIIAETGADYLHILPTNELYTDVMPEISAFPTTIFVDSEGKQVDYAYMGAVEKEVWAQRIDSAMSMVEK